MAKITRHVIVINVSLDGTGRATYVPLAYPTNGDATLSRVHTGDQVAWLVNVFSPRRAVPYQVKFYDPTLFGTDTLKVPAGGMSEYLSVRKFPSNSKYKYDVIVDGIYPICDPEMQVDKDGADSFEPHANVEALSVAASADYIITWDLEKNTIVDQTGKDASNLTIKLNDTVNWKVKQSALFAQNNLFDMLFVPNAGRIQVNPFFGWEMNTDIPGATGAAATPETGVLTADSGINVVGQYSYSLHGRSNGKTLNNLTLNVNNA